MAKEKRINKKKEEIKVDIKKVQEADRLREIVKSKLHPFLIDMNDTIRYIKIFLHTCSVAADQAFENKKDEVKIKDLDLLKFFDPKDEKVKKYKELFEMFGDETLVSFSRIVKDMPERLDQFLYFESEKQPFNSVDMVKLLG